MFSNYAADIGEIEVTRGSMEYEWKIPGGLSLQTNYKKWLSREFRFLGAAWRLYIENGTSSQLSIYNTRGGSSDLCVNYTIGIKGSDGTLYKSASGVKEVKHADFFQLPDVPFGMMPYQAKIAPQDVLTVFCNFNFHQKYCERTTQTESFENINELKKNLKDLLSSGEDSENIIELRKNLKDLLSSGEDSDVLIKIGDSEFRAHRAILRARSTVFSSMFGHDMKERGCGSVAITDCDPQAFEQFLLHVYTGKVECLSVENVCQLYQVADKYDVQDLKAECVEYMKENLTTDTFCDVISLALWHKESALIENATQFFLKNAEKILVTVQWLSFLKENPVVANELTLKSIHFLAHDKN